MDVNRIIFHTVHGVDVAFDVPVGVPLLSRISARSPQRTNSTRPANETSGDDCGGVAESPSVRSPEQPDAGETAG